MDWQKVVFFIGGAVALLSGIIEFVPIKINPWSALAKAIGKAMTAELNDKVDNLGKDVNNLGKDLKSLRTDFDIEHATTCRTRILRFGDEVLHKERHSKEHFDQILLDISEYERYCSAHPEFRNNVAVATIDKIKRTYQYCLDNDSFL